MTAASRFIYVRYEMLRVLRNRRIVILSLTFPVVLYLVIAGPSRDVADFAGTGISAPLYFMVGLAAYGTMTAMLGSGGRIAADRAAGWNRQLRVSPLPSSVYLGAKVLTGYLLAALSIAVIFVCGLALGVRLPADRWLAMTALLLVGLVPFAALGIALGHLFSADSIGPAIGVGVAVLSLLGGSWFPLNGHGFLHALGQLLPSYWLVRASHVGLGEPAWGLKGWLLMTAWTIGLTVLAARVYRNDTGRAG
jgi:ABC-2 type transport system permease protein